MVCGDEAMRVSVGADGSEEARWYGVWGRRREGVRVRACSRVVVVGVDMLDEEDVG